MACNLRQRIPNVAAPFDRADFLGWWDLGRSASVPDAPVSVDCSSEAVPEKCGAVFFVRGPHDCHRSVLDDRHELDGLSLSRR